MHPILDLYGDESIRNSAVIYGLVVSPCERTNIVEAALGEVKKMFGPTEQARLHCRELFAGDKRRSSAWAHLEPKNVFALCWEVAHAVSMVGASFRVGYVNRRGLSQDMLFAGRHPRTPTGPKQLVAFAYGAVLAGFEREPGLSNVRLWIDPDRSKIDWGAKRRKATNFPVTFEGGAIQPQPIDGNKPLLLDVADILAYCSAHSLSAESRSDKEQFRKIFARFSPEVREFAFHEQTFSPPRAEAPQGCSAE